MSAQARCVQPRVRTCPPFTRRFLSLAQLSDEHESTALLLLLLLLLLHSSDLNFSSVPSSEGSAAASLSAAGPRASLPPPPPSICPSLPIRLALGGGQVVALLKKRSPCSAQAAHFSWPSLLSFPLPSRC